MRETATLYNRCNPELVTSNHTEGSTDLPRQQPRCNHNIAPPTHLFDGVGTSIRKQHRFQDFHWFPMGSVRSSTHGSDEKELYKLKINLKHGINNDPSTTGRTVPLATRYCTLLNRPWECGKTLAFDNTFCQCSGKKDQRIYGKSGANRIAHCLKPRVPG